MKIYIGADHNGYHMKKVVSDHLKLQGFTVVDDGDATLDPLDDFPVFAGRVVSELLASSDNDRRGILLCGSGQGMCMAANRFKGIRAVLGYDDESVRSSRNDDDSNVLCLPTRTLDKDTILQLISTWLNTPFSAAPRYVRRIKELDEL